MYNTLLFRCQTSPFTTPLPPFIFFVFYFHSLEEFTGLSKFWTSQKHCNVNCKQMHALHSDDDTESGRGAPSPQRRPLWWVATFAVISRIMVFFDARSDSLWLKAELATSSLFIMNSSLHQVERSATIFFQHTKKTVHI